MAPGLMKRRTLRKGNSRIDKIFLVELLILVSHHHPKTRKQKGMRVKAVTKSVARRHSQLAARTNEKALYKKALLELLVPVSHP